MAVDISKLIMDIQAGRIEICYHEDDTTGHVRGFSTHVSEEEKLAIVNALVDAMPMKDLGAFVVESMKIVPPEERKAENRTIKVDVTMDIHVYNLTRLFLQMSRAVPADNQWHVKGLEYIKKHNLQGSPLRAGDESKPNVMPIVMMFAGEEALEE